MTNENPKNHEHICPMCEKGVLIPHEPIKEQYHDRENNLYTVESIEYSTCPTCKAEISTPEQNKRNGIRIADAKHKLKAEMKKKKGRIDFSFKYQWHEYHTRILT